VLISSYFYLLMYSTNISIMKSTTVVNWLSLYFSYNVIDSVYIFLTIYFSCEFMARITQYNMMWSSLSVTCGRSVVFFPPSTSVSSTNKTDRHLITEILLKVVLSTKTILLLQYTFITNVKSAYLTNVIFL
jgi:hypothetical protein